jgi:hypothetical protein
MFLGRGRRPAERWHRHPPVWRHEHGIFQFVGQGTAEKGGPEAFICRGKGVTLVPGENGGF